MNKIDFERLVKKHHFFLTNFARKLVRDSFVEHYADSEDLVQETLLKAWAGIDSYKEMDKFRSWLTAIMINLFLTLEKKERRYGIRCNHKIWATRILSQESPEKEVLDEIIKNQIISAIRKLAPIGTAELVMRMENKDYQEIADELHEPIGTVKSRLSRGWKVLKKRKAFSSLALTT